MTEIASVGFFYKFSDANYGVAAHTEPISGSESFFSLTLQRLDDLPAMDQEKAIQLIETGIRYVLFCTEILMWQCLFKIKLVVM
jgi:hypothetical protein